MPSKRADLLVQAERQFFQSRGTLADFEEAAWHIVVPGRPFIRGRHVEVIADHLEAVTYREIKNLRVHIPPGMMKSLATCVFWPVWDWIQFPTDRFFFTSYTPSLTNGSNRLAMKLIQSPWFRKRFWDIVDVRDGAQVTDYENSKGGRRMATSIGGIATGFHPDIQVIDDPQKAKDAESDLSRASVKTWWGDTMSSRGITNPDLRKVLIMQRIHEDDLAGHIAAMEPNDWEVLNLPMEFDPSRACVTSLGGDWRTEPGELLCAELLPREKVDKLKISMGARTAAAQLDQDPAPKDGALFLRSTFRYCKEENRPKIWDFLIQSWDCTFKATTGTDFVAGQVWGISGANFYLLDEYHKRATVTETCAGIEAFAAKYPGAHAVLIEDKANGPAVMQLLASKVPGLVPVTPEGGKPARANAVTPLFESGNVYFPALEEAPWVDELVLELEKFPVGKHDDRVDALSQALVYLRGKVANLSEALEGFAELAAALGGM